MAEQEKLLWIHFGENEKLEKRPQGIEFRCLDQYLAPAEWNKITFGVNEVLLTFRSGETKDIYIVKDHVNLSGFNPLIGSNSDELGPRFPDMSEAYTDQLGGRSIQLPQAIIYAGIPEKPFSKVIFEAPQIVFQAIISMHQGKKTIALILPAELPLIEFWNKLSGGDNA